MKPSTVLVTVKYVGKNDYTDEVRGDPVFSAIMLKAMHSFDLEASAADKYVLQYEGRDLDGKAHVSSLEQNTIVLTLTLKEEPVKG